jgi:hypothetical protein
MRSNADGQNKHKNMEDADDIATLLRMVASDEMELEEVVPPGIGVDKAKINAFIKQQQKKSTVDCTKRDILTGKKSPPRPRSAVTSAPATCTALNLPAPSTIATNPTVEVSPKSELMTSSMSHMFGAGTVMNNCTFNISFKMAEMKTVHSPIPAKRRRIIDVSDE